VHGQIRARCAGPRVSRTGRRHPADRGWFRQLEPGGTLLRPSARRLPRALAGRAQGEPGLYDDMSWIGATYALPGGIVIGLASNEWSAYRHREEAGAVPSIAKTHTTMPACSTPSRRSCPRTEGARSAMSRAIIWPRRCPTGSIPSPRRHRAPAWRRCRTSSPRRIPLRVPRCAGVGEQRSGSCLMRTSDLPHARAWRAWNGSDFSVEFADPYGGEPIEAEAPLHAGGARRGELNPARRLIRHLCRPVSRLRAIGRGRVIAGVFYATTPDLIHWSPWQLLMQIPRAGLREIIYHPSMLATTMRRRISRAAAIIPICTS